jgi:hypothetical protein
MVGARGFEPRTSCAQDKSSLFKPCVFSGPSAKFLVSRRGFCARFVPMSREFSVRVSEDLAAWVRRQGPPSRVLGAVASAAHRGHLRADVPDPGPGSERLTVRVPERALPRIRELTRSRDSLVGLRKLLLAGYQGKALPGSMVERPALPVRTSTSPLRALSAPQSKPDPVHCPSTPTWGSPSRYLNPSALYQAQEVKPSTPSPLAENAPKGFQAVLARHPVMLSVLLTAFPLLGLLLLFLFAKPRQSARAKVLPAVSPLPKDSSWVPEAASRLSRLIW